MLLISPTAFSGIASELPYFFLCPRFDRVLTRDFDLIEFLGRILISFK